MLKKLLLRSVLLLVCSALSWPVLESRAQGGRDLASFADHSGSVPAPISAQAPALSCPTAAYTVDDGVGSFFDDISGTGTDLDLFDGEEADIAIPFSFDFYCASYTSLTVGSSGGLSFDTPSPNIPFTNSCFPVGALTTFIAPAWDDWVPTMNISGGVYWQVKGAAPNRRLIVQWNAMENWLSSPSPATFQVVLYETHQYNFFSIR